MAKSQRTKRTTSSTSQNVERPSQQQPNSSPPTSPEKTRWIYLDGFVCTHKNPAYTQAAKTSGTKHKEPVYWFHEEEVLDWREFTDWFDSADWDELESAAIATLLGNRVVDDNVEMQDEGAGESKKEKRRGKGKDKSKVEKSNERKGDKD
jgi:hypothetical protein